VALGTALIWGLALTQPHKLTEGTWTLNLVGGCYLDYHVSIQAVALSRGGLHATLAIAGQTALTRPNGLAGGPVCLEAARSGVKTIEGGASCKSGSIVQSAL
jgi:hypothetical protein